MNANPEAARSGAAAAAAADPARPSFAEAAAYWLKLGFISFGGVAGQLAMMQAEVVDRRRWIDQARFLHALNYCMLLPGPEAQQLATYLGWRLHGLKGAVTAGVLFVLPGALVLLLLSWVAAAHGDVPAVEAVFDGVKPVVLAIVLAALWRMGRRTLKGPPALALAVAAFLGLFLLDIPFPLIVLGAGVVGVVAARAGIGGFAPGVADEGPGPAVPTGGLARVARLAAVFAVLWAVPVAGVVWLLGPEPFADVARLFTMAAFVTFGGAYAVLPYVAEAAVETYGWLGPEQMLAGLALAESTPGPTILVVQYIGFFAGWSSPGALSPGAAAVAAALLATYVTFLPSFLFILAGGPYVETIVRNRSAAAALAGITAAVVGVIANLALFLGIPVVLPDGAPDPFAVALALAALWLLVARGLAVHWAVLAGAAAGLGQAALLGTL
jgi:chromate transporter